MDSAINITNKLKMNDTLERSNRTFDNLILYLYPLITYQGYNYIGFDLRLFKMFHFVALALLILYVGKVWYKRSPSKIFSSMRLLTVAYVISIVMAYLYWDQSIILSFRAYTVSLGIVYYFFLEKMNPGRRKLEHVIYLYGFIHIVLWLYGMSKAPVTIFTIDEANDLEHERGMYRLLLPGMGTSLAFFIAMNRWKEEKKIIHIVLTIVFGAFLIFTLTRQVILFSAIAAALYYFKGNTKGLIISSIVVLGLYFYIGPQLRKSIPIIDGLISLSEDQLAEQQHGQEYIRFSEYKYFFTDYNRNNPMTILFGNGQFHVESKHGRYMESVQDKYNYFASDVGYADCFIRFGVFGLITVILICIRCSTKKMIPNCQYAKYYMIFVTMLNLFSSCFIDQILTICIAAYITEKYGESYKFSKENSPNPIHDILLIKYRK